ncbi:MAG: hypothetical protein JWO51_4123 [Rhodospirillales bacterium]|jgi:hypothetical protein|nr:hypothetical protein [Rhodospirillales bacterium]
MNPVPLFWAIGLGLLLLLLTPRIHRVVITGFARRLGVAETNRESVDAMAGLHEARQHLATMENTSRDLMRERNHLKDKIAGAQRDIAAPRRERVDLVFELGTPRPEEGCCLFAAVRLPAPSQVAGSNGRMPDPDVWRQARLVRVWGQNAGLCQSMAEQRFGSKRDFQLVPIDEHQRARLHL